MRRRTLIAALGTNAVISLTAGHGRAQNLPIVAVLSPQASESAPVFGVFRARLKELGQVEGRKIRLDFRFAAGQLDRIPILAAELLASLPTVILADGAFIAQSLKDLTSLIPIVGILGPDPVASGLITSLGRPGANITGVTTLGRDLQVKRIELLKEAFPGLARLALLWDRSNDPGGLMIDSILGHTARMGLRVEVLEGGRADVLAASLAPDRLRDVDAILVSQGPSHYSSRDQIVSLIAASRKPAIYPERDYIAAGGLMSYGPRVADVFRRLAELTDRILKGARPGDLAVEQVARVEYVINLKTAKALEVSLSPIVINRADEVID